MKDQTDNTAARVWKKRSYWPFVKYEWLVWSPFSDDSAADGETSTEDAAIDAANRALDEMIAEAEKEMVDA